MFSTTLEELFTHKQLQAAFTSLSTTSKGIDEISYEQFKATFYTHADSLIESILLGSYTPEPIKKIEIPKNDHAMRPIAMGAIKDKLVQRVLYETLNPYFDPMFADNSYAYRPGKSTVKAINRVTNYLNQKKLIVIKTDIKEFFESINHDLLLKKLSTHIKDTRIVRLISLFLQIGGFKNIDYFDHIQGVHQGDILSPLLSNIYLDTMDQYLIEQNIAFVRYADDFVMLFEVYEEAKKAFYALKAFLGTIFLELNEKKSTITHVSKGFTFLGIQFQGRNRIIDNDRFQQSISKLHQLSKDRAHFLLFVENINHYINGLKNYYLKILQKDTGQFKLLQESLTETLSHKIYLSKKSKNVNTKREFRIFLEKIDLNTLYEPEQIKNIQELVLAKGYEKYLADRSYKENSVKIDKQKNLYAKKFAQDATIHIYTYGMMLALSKNKFILKQYGKVVNAYPVHKVTRIIFEGRGFSISSDVLNKCAFLNISVDFIDGHAMHYASLITYKASLTQNIHKQAMLINTPKQLELAGAFIHGKAKNQLNYLKYLNKYHKTLEVHITQIQLQHDRIHTARSTAELMGLEGAISASYWEALRLVLDVPFEKRITYGARDVVNTSLNYAYAIVYASVQHALVHAGLSLSISFLHAFDTKKPTLVFDMIEEFRTFIVDRSIISMLNNQTPIKLGSDGLLTEPSRKLIAKTIKEKLGSYTMWRRESRKIEHIITAQCQLLARSIEDPTVKYKPFIGKY